MRIKDILPRERVIPDLKATTRDEVIAELAAIVAASVPASREELVEALLERERQAPTAISGGVAVPHARIAELDEFVLAVGRSSAGVAFEAEDGPTKIFFLLMAPTSETVAHLKVLARIARMLQNKRFRGDLMVAKSARDLHQRILEEDERT